MARPATKGEFNKLALEIVKLDRRQVITDHRIDPLEKRINALERRAS